MNESENPPAKMIGPGVITFAIVCAYIPIMILLHLRAITWLGHLIPNPAGFVSNHDILSCLYVPMLTIAVGCTALGYRRRLRWMTLLAFGTVAVLLGVLLGAASLDELFAGSRRC